jgi:hypothetical protein
MQHWKNFYRDHKDYFRVGRVTHKPIEPSSPIPVHCKDKKAEKQGQERAETGTAASEKTRQEHEEL